MGKNARSVLMAVVVAAALISVGLLARDVWLGQSQERHCPDGIHHTIDLRAFTTAYHTYSAEFEATLGSRRLSGKVSPQRLQELSEAAQQANEFRKYIVAGFNACAITRAQYFEYGDRYKMLDDLGRRIDGLAPREPLTEADRARLDELIGQYVEVARQLAGGQR